MSGTAADRNKWPALPWEEWSDTANTLHMWTQIVGKTRLALTPLQNHWWNVPLYVTAHGLGTSAMPYGNDVLDIEFDFIAHALHLRLGSGVERSIKLRPQTVADFYQHYMSCLSDLGVRIDIWPMPVEVANPIRFDLDTTHKSYDPEYAHRFWQILVQAEKVFREFGTRTSSARSAPFTSSGAASTSPSPASHGRPAPPRPGADSIQREAYSHEVISAGFWPGNGGLRSRRVLLLRRSRPRRPRRRKDSTARRHVGQGFRRVHLQIRRPPRRTLP